jgi:hypothetical protein
MTTTDVRTAVAKLASTPATPNFARIAVMAANKAESKAHVSQFIASGLQTRTLTFNEDR